MIAGAAATPAISVPFKVTTSPTGVCSGATCSKLASGDVISVSGTGFSANQLASILECNDDPSQPVVLYLGNYVPVSCTKIVIVATSKTGTFGPQSFTMVTGTTGPPATPYTPTCLGVLDGRHHHHLLDPELHHLRGTRTTEPRPTRARPPPRSRRPATPVWSPSATSLGERPVGTAPLRH